eukprot:SAG31_NODE_5651_length_2403_cov_10.626736_3_plen_216_part_00
MDLTRSPRMSKPPLPGKRAPQAATALDKTLVLQLTGESDVADVRELVARGMGITTLDMASLGAHSWDRLEQLSLSHNKVGSAVWQWLGHCPSLKSLNLNFCDLDTLEGVQALPDLQKLYLSSNKVRSAVMWPSFVLNPLARSHFRKQIRPSLGMLLSPRQAYSEPARCLAVVAAMLSRSGAAPICKHCHSTAMRWRTWTSAWPFWQACQLLRIWT